MRKQALVAALWTFAELCSANGHCQIFQGLPPAVPPLTGNEQVPADTGSSPPSVRITTSQLGSFVLGSEPGQNWLIAGDATQNLWQRGVTGPTSTGTVVWGPDRWAYWSVGGTPMVVSKGSAAYRMQRVAGTSLVGDMCFTQVISSQNSEMLQGQYVVLNFTVFGGVNLSATGIGIYIVTGTGFDEGVSKLAFGFNGGGGGSSGWAGQSEVVGAVYTPLIVSGAVRPAVVGKMPVGENEAAVVLCVTPSGTAGGSDYVEFSQVQLRQAPILAPFASPTVAYNSPVLPAPPFAWRLENQEAFLQYSYYWQLTEGVGLDVIGGSCAELAGSTEADCAVLFPMQLRKVPTMSYTAGFATDANSGGQTPCTSLGTKTGAVASRNAVLVACGAAVNVKSASFLYEHGGSGMIKADAELE